MEEERRKRRPGRTDPANVDEARRRWRAFMDERGLSASKARDAIVEVFFATTEHAGLQQIFEAARRRHAGVGFATVYRTMKLLDEAGLAHARNFGTGRTTLYEVAVGRAHHDHLICEGCGSIVEFFDPEVEAQQEQIARRHGFALMRHRHELYGLCPQCRPRGRGGTPES